MCGVLTVIHKKGSKLNPGACRRALSLLSWRGPDLCISSIWNNQIFIGQTVLALTGEVQNRRSTFNKSASGRFIIAFNGEIYNYRELAEKWLGNQFELTDETSDTEVLVSLHDVLPAKDIPALLDGMYAYAVLDKKDGSVHVSRDTQGEKSLYIYEDNNIIVIASEIPAIQSLVSNIEIDTQALRDYFRTRHFMLFSRTIYYRIRQILPGLTERFQVSNNKWKIIAKNCLSDWIDPGRVESNAARSLNSLTDELDALITQSTKEMIPVNKPYAAIVSGGVDSSLLAHYLVIHGQPNALVAVNHIGKDFISSDLSGFEKVLNRRIDVLNIDKAAYSAAIGPCQDTCRGPLSAHSFVPQTLLSAFVHSNGCKAMFGGEGADEFFGGYDAYLSNTNDPFNYSPSPYLTYETPEVEFLEDDPTRIKQELSDAWQNSQNAYKFVTNEPERRSLAMMYGDAGYQLPTVGLRSADLMSMMRSVETRTIFLRKNMLKFALNLPLSARIDPTAKNPHMRTKVLLKRLFLRYYPEKLLTRKQGFAGFPNESAGYLGDLGDYITFDVLGIRPPTKSDQFSNATLWKLANVEYFLRARFI
jgi:asparagine synthase (glutamine-hydrolysing)